MIDVCVHLNKLISECTPHQLLQIVTNGCRAPHIFPVYHLISHSAHSVINMEKIKLPLADFGLDHYGWDWLGVSTNAEYGERLVSIKTKYSKNIVSYCKKCKKLFNCVHHHKNWKISKILNVDSSQSKPC